MWLQWLWLLKVNRTCLWTVNEQNYQFLQAILQPVTTWKETHRLDAPTRLMSHHISCFCFDSLLKDSDLVSFCHIQFFSPRKISLCLLGRITINLNTDSSNTPLANVSLSRLLLSNGANHFVDIVFFHGKYKHFFFLVSVTLHNSVALIQVSVNVTHAVVTAKTFCYTDEVDNCSDRDDWKGVSWHFKEKIPNECKMSIF